jgi:hypothetical protein
MLVMSPSALVARTFDALGANNVARYKLGSRTSTCVFVDYVSHGKAYRFL